VSRRLPKNLLSLALVIFTIIVFATYWDTGHSNINELFDRPTLSKSPDIYLNSTVSRRFDKQGTLEYKLASDDAIHLPHNDTVKMRNPNLITFAEGAPAWYVRANQGTSQPGGKVLELHDGVVIQNADASLKMQTQSVIITPDKKYAETDQPVTMTGNTGQITTAVGMNAWLDSKRFQFLSRVRSQYETN